MTFAKSSFVLLLSLLMAGCAPGKERVSTFAGSGKAGSADGPAGTASFSNLMGIAADSAGNIFIADSRNHKIRKADAAGSVSTVAGTGQEGAADGPGLSASFFFPAALAVSGNGDIYVADTHNNLIRKISASGVVSTIAGRITPIDSGHPEAISRLDNPAGIAVGPEGTIYFTDWGKNLVRKLTPDRKMSVVAGTGRPGARDGNATLASFHLPEGIAVDAGGNLYVADTYNNLIRKISASGMVTTVAGRPGRHNKGAHDGKGPAASFFHPTGIALDRTGNIYVADMGNNSIRKIDRQGAVSTVAGCGLRGSADGELRHASFNRPFGIAADVSGNLFVADYENNVVRKISFR